MTTTHCSNPFFTALINRHYYPDKSPSSSILNPGFRHLVKKAYKRASGNGRKVFRTKVGEGDTNPVYDVAYSPVGYRDHRVIAVGDELGWLSIVKVGFEGKSGGEGGSVFNRGVQSVAPCQNGSEDDSFDNQDGHVYPVLYSVAWNASGSKVLSGYGDGSIRIWDLEKGSRPVCVTGIEAYEKSLKRVAWSGETIISCSRTNEIQVHDQRMRTMLANRIDCNQIGAKLTDICVLEDNYVVASSSNQSGVHVFDLRYTYKLYKRIKPVQTFDLSSPGYTTLTHDSYVQDGVVYALGSDSVVRSFDFKSGEVLGTYVVPCGVDFFTKIDVDRVAGVLVSGSCGDSAFGFDLFSEWEKGVHCGHFVKFREGGRVKVGEDDGLDEEDKENCPENSGVRSFSAVGVGGRRGGCCMNLQIACGGDNSTITVYD